MHLGHKRNQASFPQVFAEALRSLDASTYGTASSWNMHFRKCSIGKPEAQPGEGTDAGPRVNQG